MEEQIARHRATIAQMNERVGSEFGVSDWIAIDQPMVDQFAKLTFDEYFIHLDAERAKRETPHGGTIAHGFLTLSLLSQMAYQVCPMIDGTKSGVNYGFNRMRFVSAVPTGSRVRGRFALAGFQVEAGKRWTATWNVTVEIEGAAKPAIVAEWLTAGFL